MGKYCFNCTNCGQQLEAQDGWANMQTECPLCHETIVIPERIVPAVVPHVQTPCSEQIRLSQQAEGFQRCSQQSKYKNVEFKSHLIDSIVFLLICLPFGIPALIFSLKAQSQYDSGQIDEAFSSAKIARIISMIGAGFTLILIILYESGKD